jgi:acyl-CoA thioesterase
MAYLHRILIIPQIIMMQIQKTEKEKSGTMPDTEKEITSPRTGPHQFAMDDWISCAPFERLLHIEIVEASYGQAVLKMPFYIDYAQGAGLMHGGALVSLADTAVVMAIKSLIPPLSHFATISLEAKFLLPVKKGNITARAKVIEKEDRILKGRAIVYDDDERAVLEFSSIFKIAKDTRIQGITFGNNRS